MSSSSSSHAKPHREAGDKVFVGGSLSDKKIFIADVINCIQEKGPKTLLITMSVLSEYLHAQSALSASNLYRKPLASLIAASAAGDIDASLLAQCTIMHKDKRRHDLSTMKTVGKNECKTCKEQYPVIANSPKACNGRSEHKATHDFDKDEDVFKCELP